MGQLPDKDQTMALAIIMANNITKDISDPELLKWLFSTLAGVLATEPASVFKTLEAFKDIRAMYETASDEQIKEFFQAFAGVDSLQEFLDILKDPANN